MDRKMSGSSSRKGSRDAGSMMSGEDSKVVREGDKVYVITEYTLQEEEELEQPRSLCLVSLCTWMDVMCTSVQDVLLFMYNMYFLGCYFATFTKFVNTLRWDGGQSLYIYWTLISDVDNLSV